MAEKGKLNLVMLVIVWGTYYIANKLALSTFSATFTGIFIRLFVFIVMVFYMWYRKELMDLFRVQHVFPRLVLIGLLGFLLDFTAFIGFKYSSASKGSILLRSDVLFSTLISFLLGQRVVFSELILMVFMLVGVFLVSGLQLSQFALNIADLLFLLSALFISINAFLIRSVQKDKSNPVSDNVIAFYNNLFTLVFFVIFSGSSVGMVEFSHLGFNGPTIALTIASIGQFLIYVVYYSSLRKFPVWLVRSVLLLMPVYVSTFSFIFLGERLSMTQIIGMAIILLCAYLLIRNNYGNTANRRTKSN